MSNTKRAAQEIAAQLFSREVLGTDVQCVNCEHYLQNDCDGYTASGGMCPIETSMSEYLGFDADFDI